MRAPLARLLALLTLLASCRTPTSVTLVLSSDVACVDAPTTSVAVSRSNNETLAPAKVTQVCQPDGHIGTLVVVPAADKDEDLRVRVVTSISGSSCEPPTYGPGCIVSRRQLQFIAHEELTVPIAQLINCAGVACDASTTCRKGSCVVAQVDQDRCKTNPAQCGIEITPDPTEPARLVSSWVGTNVSADLPRVDIVYQLAPFDLDASLKDADGYPLPGQSATSGTDLGFLLPVGTYKLSYRGTGTVSISGIGTLSNEVTMPDGQHRADVAISGFPGQFFQMFYLTVNNGEGQSVSDIHLLSPGFEHGSEQLFTTQFLDALRPFKTLRFMEWEGSIDSTLSDWNQRAQARQFGDQVAGEPWEHIVALINQTGKDAWFTTYDLADDAFTTQMATYLAANLDRAAIDRARRAQGVTEPWQLVLESSHDAWNDVTVAYSRSLAEANKNPARYTGVYDGAYPSLLPAAPGESLIKISQYQADRLVREAAIFRQAFTAAGYSASTVAPSLSGWDRTPIYSDAGLRFIKANHGEPRDLVRLVSIAPYFVPADDQTSSLDALFAATSVDIDARGESFAQFAKLASEHGVTIAASEGGQRLTGLNNLGIKHRAQHDRRMYDAYLRFFALWQKHFGKAPFVHFVLAGVPGFEEEIFQYGFWGSLQGIREDTTTCVQNIPTLAGTEPLADVVHFCPKYRALAEQVP